MQKKKVNVQSNIIPQNELVTKQKRKMVCLIQNAFYTEVHDDSYLQIIILKSFFLFYLQEVVMLCMSHAAHTRVSYCLYRCNPQKPVVATTHQIQRQLAGPKLGQFRSKKFQGITKCPRRFTSINIKHIRESILVGSIDGIVQRQVTKLLKMPLIIKLHCSRVCG